MMAVAPNIAGRSIPASEVRAAVDAVIEGAKAEAEALVRALHDAKSSPDAMAKFEKGMMLLIAGLHSLASHAATAGVSGVLPELERALQANLDASVARERAYLSGFLVFLGLAKVIMDTGVGIPSAGGVTLMSHDLPSVARRAASYMPAALITYEAQRHLLYRFLDFTEARRRLRPGAEHCAGCVEQAEHGWVPIEAFIPLGHEECGQFCECEVDYQRTAIHAEVAE